MASTSPSVHQTSWHVLLMSHTPKRGSNRIRSLGPKKRARRQEESRSPSSAEFMTKNGHGVQHPHISGGTIEQDCIRITMHHHLVSLPSLEQHFCQAAFDFCANSSEIDLLVDHHLWPSGGFNSVIRQSEIYQKSGGV